MFFQIQNKKDTKIKTNTKAVTGEDASIATGKIDEPKIALFVCR